MKKMIIIFCVFVANICAAQENKEAYSFIEVSDRFEFLSGDNPYQLSDMMVFYLEKKGMKAYRKVDSPNVAKCDVLYADMQEGNSVINTKLVFVLKDCNNRTIFKSKEGKSKIKEHAKAYPDALRMTFKTFEKKDINMVSVINLQEELGENVTGVTESLSENVEVVNPDIVKVNTVVEIPQELFSNYSLSGQSYLLKKVGAGYTFFLTQVGNDNFVKIGEISMMKDASFKMVDIYGENKSGYFNENQDLIIKLPSGGELVYSKKH